MSRKSEIHLCVSVWVFTERKDMGTVAGENTYPKGLYGRKVTKGSVGTNSLSVSMALPSIIDLSTIFPSTIWPFRMSIPLTSQGHSRPLIVD